MAHQQVSLMAYLQRAPQAIRVIEKHQSPNNTTNPAYSWEDIQLTQRWNSFTIEGMSPDYIQLLQAARITDEAFPASPPQPISNKATVRKRVSEYIIPRVRRALRSGFESLVHKGNMGSGRSFISLDVGGAALQIDQVAPDIAFFNMDEGLRQRPNRVPGIIELSFKWSSGNREALAQVNHCMMQHRARYGFIITDKELVAIRRLDVNGNLELSPSIPWNATGAEEEPQMTVLLGLWYLAMLASIDAHWQL